MESFKVSAPTRADLAGGTLDLWPLYCLFGEAKTINVALDLSAIANFEVTPHPDFLIVALERSDRLPGICEKTLRNHPQIRVIAIAPDRDKLMFYSASLRILSDQLEASEASVLNVLRGKSQPLGRTQ